MNVLNCPCNKIHNPNAGRAIKIATLFVKKPIIKKRIAKVKFLIAFV
jgi:hypothetical protein